MTRRLSSIASWMAPPSESSPPENNATALTNLGSALFEASEVNVAKDCFLQALEINPREEMALYNLGFSLVHQGALADGILCFENEPYEFILQGVGGNFEITEGDLILDEVKTELVFIGRLEGIYRWFGFKFVRRSFSEHNGICGS